MLSVLLIPGSATLLPEHITYICAIKVIDFAAPMLDFSCGRGTDKNAEFLKYIHFFKKILYPLVCGALQALPPSPAAGLGLARVISTAVFVGKLTMHLLLRSYTDVISLSIPRQFKYAKQNSKQAT